jgi:hypothetical protein
LVHDSSMHGITYKIAVLLSNHFLDAASFVILPTTGFDDFLGTVGGNV